MTSHNTTGGESTMDKIKDKLHLGGNKDTTSTTHTTGAHNTGTHTTGAHTSGAPEGTYGTHNSRVANAADPRIDSDADHRANPTSITGSGYGATTGSGYGATTGTGYGSTTGTGIGSTTGTSTNHGPHNSNLTNKVDPRVDSDRDGRANPISTTGGYGTTTGGYDGTTTGSHGLASHTGTTGHTGTAGHTGTTGYTGTGSHGLTSHTGTTGHTGTAGHTGTTGGLSRSTNAGPHDSNMANKADPRVDSDLDGRGNRHGANTGGILGTSGSHATHGSGTAQNTDGPHNSDLLNKLDPRVDSDRDGSKTVGGNKTHA